MGLHTDVELGSTLPAAIELSGLSNQLQLRATMGLGLSLWPLYAVGLITQVAFPVAATIAASVVGYAILRTRAVATISRDQVSTEYRGPFASPPWQEPLQAYQGLRWRWLRYSGNQVTQRTIASIELVHGERNKTVTIWQRRGRSNLDVVPRSLLEHYANLLQVPVLVEDAGVIRSRAPEDLNKNVQTLLAEGKVAAPTAPQLVAKQRMPVSKSGSAQIVTLPLQPHWITLGLAAGCIVIGVLASAVMVVIGVGIGFFAWQGRRQELESPRTLRLQSTGVIYTQPALTEQIEASELEEIRIENRELLFVADSKKIAIRGLTRDQRLYLQAQAWQVLGRREN